MHGLNPSINKKVLELLLEISSFKSFFFSTICASRIPRRTQTFVARQSVEANRAIRTNIIRRAVIVAPNTGQVLAVAEVGGAEAPIGVFVGYAAVVE